MRISIFIFSLLLAGQVVMAQSAEDEVIRLKQSMAEEMTEEAVLPQAQSDLELDAEGNSSKKEDGLKGHWNFSVGTNFTYMQGYGSMMGLYAAPTYTLPLNDRWALHGGVIASNYTGLGSMQMPGPESQTTNNYSSLAVFAAASYKMTDRLILHGSALKNLTSYPLTPMAPGVMDNISMGATYKLGDNVSIGASVSFNQGRGYYNSSPFGGGSFGGPYGGPYGSPFGW
ncbi:MAG: hypothetical protein QNK35_07845 [Bacteroides sp.]|nr:hypothetical protein [Bacteroides sp.]